MKHLEDQHQEALVTWANCANLPCGEKIGQYLFAIPNGGKRGKAEGARFKKQGVKAGVSDLFLAYPFGEYAGLWIEMKAPAESPDKKPKSRPTAAQKEWLNRMLGVGYDGAVCYGWHEARQLITNYLKLGKK